MTTQERTIPAVTIDDLLASEDRVEVVDGEFVEMSPTGFEHNIVTTNIYDLLRPHVKQHKLGYAGVDGLIFVLHSDERGVRYTRVPDVFFISKDRIPEFDISKPFPGAPDLAVEVVSPMESDESILEKLENYFDYGTEQVWVVYPQHKTVYQYFDLKTITVHRDDDVLTAESLFPGLQIAITEFLVMPDFD